MLVRNGPETESGRCACEGPPTPLSLADIGRTDTGICVHNWGFLVCISLALQAQNFFGSDSAFYCTPTRPAAIVLSMSLFLVSIAIGFLIANLYYPTDPRCFGASGSARRAILYNCECGTD
jgi:hypothetical protein